MTAPINWSHLPISSPDGTLIPHLSARYRTQMMDAVFVGSGGFDRMLAWVNKSDDNYGDFLKMWARGQAKATSVEVGLGEGVESMLAHLDAGENARVVSGDDE